MPISCQLCIKNMEGSLTLVDVGEIRAKSGDGFKDGCSMDVSSRSPRDVPAHTGMGHQEP
jgi:hypothetical protein